MVIAGVAGRAQAPVPGPTFDVVSIKPSAPETGPTYSANIVTQHPDGGLTAIRTPVATLIARAYPGMSRPDMIGLPDWARQFYDVHATSSLGVATADDRAAMMRAMLADRFRLLVHTERRDMPSFDLTLARSGGAVGPGLTRIDVDCEAVAAARRAAEEAARRNGDPLPARPPLDPNALPPCTYVMGLGGARGEVTMETLVLALRGLAGRVVVNKTGLAGSYRVNLSVDEPASVFTAVREQLGLKIEPSRTQRDVLVIDRLERPTEN
jgi:uncharacterized protein (TIGR03435 family)